MAYTSSPQFDTYKSAGITFDGEDLFRSGDLSINRDLQIVNFYYDKISQTNKTTEQYLVKRPGFVNTDYPLHRPTPATDVLRGSYYDTVQNAFFWVTGNTVYMCKPDQSPDAVFITTLGTSVGYVGFCSYLKSDDTIYTVFSDGIGLYLYNIVANATVPVTDANMPTPHLPYPIYLDGYIFLAKSASGDIYNSNNDDPFTWTSGEFFTAEMSSDYIHRLAKAKNYIVALGDNSIEYFYDAGTATGSPLARNDSPYRSVGYVAGFAQVGDAVIFVGQDGNQNIAVYSLLNFKVDMISNSVVNSTLQDWTTIENIKGFVNDKDGFSISLNGRNFYLLVTPVTTWAYDVDDKYWYEWKDSNGAVLNIEASWNMKDGGQYVAVHGQPSISKMSPKSYQDFGVNFTCRYITEEFTQQTYNWKTLHRMIAIGDQYTNTGASNLMISWSDDDGSSWSPPRAINLFSKSPFITRCGRFRKRMFKIEYTDNYPLRLRALELELNVGSN